ncbi:MAG TPA: hypothetical protein VKR79_04865 [Gaiellaceae bacterium]|nr:hypothetical protein [Gaiellaceae bacterium]
MKLAAVATCLCAVLLAGCGGSGRSILYQGITSPLGGKTFVVSDAAAVGDGRSARTEWLVMVRRAERQGPAERFANLSARVFRLRLARAASRHGFVVKEVRFLRLPQATPLVVVETSRYLAFAKAVPAIEHSLDPHTGRSDAKGWSFAAFCLEALDERGVPFLVVSNVVISGSVAGEQWARSDPLFPFVRA